MKFIKRDLNCLDPDYHMRFLSLSVSKRLQRLSTDSELANDIPS